MAVGTLLTDYLDQKGWNIVHSVEYNDFPDFNRSYLSSLNLIKDTTAKYDDISIAIDIHRDGMEFHNNSDIENEKERMTTTINGEEVAKFFFVVGQANPNASHVDTLAKEITELAEEMYPGIVGPIIYHEDAKFNLYMVENHMLIEVGSNGTTSEQAKATTKYLAEVLDAYFEDHKE